MMWRGVVGGDGKSLGTKYAVGVDIWRLERRVVRWLSSSVCAGVVLGGFLFRCKAAAFAISVRFVVCTSRGGGGGGAVSRFDCLSRASSCCRDSDILCPECCTHAGDAGSALVTPESAFAAPELSPPPYVSITSVSPSLTYRIPYLPRDSSFFSAIHSSSFLLSLSLSFCRCSAFSITLAGTADIALSSICLNALRPRVCVAIFSRLNLRLGGGGRRGSGGAAGEGAIISSCDSGGGGRRERGKAGGRAILSRCVSRDDGSGAFTKEERAAVTLLFEPRRRVRA